MVVLGKYRGQVRNRSYFFLKVFYFIFIEILIFYSIKYVFINLFLIFIFQIGEVILKNKKKLMVVVQLLQDRDSVMNIDFDYVCEFVGDIYEQFDY